MKINKKRPGLAHFLKKSSMGHLLPFQRAEREEFYALHRSAKIRFKFRMLKVQGDRHVRIGPTSHSRILRSENTHFIVRESITHGSLGPVVMRRD